MIQGGKDRMSTDGTGRQSPLGHLRGASGGGSVLEGGAVLIFERPFLGYLNLRGDAGDGDFASATWSALGFHLPTEPNRTVGKDSLTAHWLGPDEWLVVTPPNVQTWLIDSLEASLEDVHASVTDLTGGYTTISLSGPKARDVLAKGCPLDLHPAVFSPGDCAQTLVAKAGAMIRCVDDSPSFELVVRRSFAEYAALWLRDAALEYGESPATNG